MLTAFGGHAVVVGRGMTVECACIVVHADPVSWEDVIDA